MGTVDGLRAGYAAAEITPSRNYDLSGYVARDNPGVGVHDPVQVSGLYLAAKEAVLVLSVSVLGFTPEDALLLRRRLARQCGISVEHVMLAATHTHAAPATMRLHGCGTPDAAWWNELQSVIERVARQAQATAQPARIGVGTTHVPGIVRNRRDAAGPIDEALTVVKVELQRDQRSCALVNYACHPVVLSSENRLVSGDYPGVVTRYMAGKGVDAMFITGACGDINPLARGDFDVVDDIGERLGRAALELLPTIETAGGVVRATTATVKVRWEMPTPDELHRARAEAHGALYQTPPAGSAAERIKQTWDAWIDRHRSQSPPWPNDLNVPVQVIEAGPARIVALPGEVFCRTGLFIKEHLGPGTVIAGYTNGNIGYLPTTEQYPRGGYEVEQAHVYYGYPGVVAPGTAEQMARVAVDLSKQMRG